MIDTILEWVSVYGPIVLAAAMITGQMGIPVPTTIILLTLGALIPDGTNNGLFLGLAGLAGAVCGDQISYWIGREGGKTLIIWSQGTRWEVLLNRASRYSSRWGAPGVFLSRWLVSPIGPYVNYIAGMTKMSWALFSAMSVLGEAIWITIYLSLGAIFSTSISAIDEFVTNLTWFIGALIISAFLGLRLKKLLKDNRASKL